MEKRQAIRVGILIGVLALLGVSLAVTLLRENPSKIKPFVTPMSTFIYTWHCYNCKHEADLPAGVGGVPCPKCSKPEFWPTAKFKCAEHGQFRIGFDFTANNRLKRVRVEDGPWVPDIDEKTMEAGRVCPKCKKPLVPDEPVRRTPSPEDSNS
jgi:hypothetical protein